MKLSNACEIQQPIVHLFPFQVFSSEICFLKNFVSGIREVVFQKFFAHQFKQTHGYFFFLIFHFELRCSNVKLSEKIIK